MNEVEDLAERLENINISTNMEPIKDRRDVFLQNVKLLQPFDGNKSYLALFVDSVSAMIPSEATNPDERRFYFNCIKTTLRRIKKRTTNGLDRSDRQAFHVSQRRQIQSYYKKLPIFRLWKLQLCC